MCSFISLLNSLGKVGKEQDLITLELVCYDLPAGDVLYSEVNEIAIHLFIMGAPGNSNLKGAFLCHIVYCG